MLWDRRVLHDLDPGLGQFRAELDVDRRLIGNELEYVLSPVMQHMEESGRER